MTATFEFFIYIFFLFGSTYDKMVLVNSNIKLLETFEVMADIPRDHVDLSYFFRCLCAMSFMLWRDTLP